VVLSNTQAFLSVIVFWVVPFVPVVIGNTLGPIVDAVQATRSRTRSRRSAPQAAHVRHHPAVSGVVAVSASDA
jgi:hypothetical protein